MDMNIVVAIVTIVAGVIVLIWPKILNYIVAFYLIITGVLLLIDAI
jgi:hypothetical protein